MRPLAIRINKGVLVPSGVRSALSLAQKRIKQLSKEEFVNEELYEASTHLLKSPGKMVRPGLVFSSALLLGEDPKEYVDLAVAIELLHTASLIHDDILDMDSIRRSREAVHIKFGTEKAILAGDALIAKAIQLASAYGPIAVRRASEASMDMCAGETIDIMVQSKQVSLDLNSYLKIAQLKTASLMGVSASVVADCISSGERQALYEIGMNMGYSFQLRDDIMNHLGINEESRKSTTSDSSRSRPNIVSVFEAHGKDSPVKTAIKLNNFYIERAIGLLNDLRNGGMFKAYLDFLKIDE
ncbi:MAG: polyprenyl synthetase family protein [Candidatus Micrarchaeales archaeon]|nr:polyprenyl synthetase family protein [Candidatus Micrarchaeales archaeon]